MRTHNNNKPRFAGAVNKGPKPMYFVHLGQRFELLDVADGFHYRRAPNNKLVRRMERKQILQHRKPNGNSIMHKITAFRRELGALAPKPSPGPKQRRAEKRRRAAANAQVVLMPSGISRGVVDAIARPTNDGRGGVIVLDRSATS